MELNNIRAWDIQRNKMHENVMVMNGKPFLYWLSKEERTLEYEEIDGYVLLPTGIKDKNGREVYEGVIIKYKDTKGVVKFGKYKNPSDDDNGGHVGFFVEFEDETAKSMFRKDLIFWLNVSEAIGDIYKNPELLSPT